MLQTSRRGRLSKRAVWTLRALLCCAAPALCIIGRFEVGKSSGAAVLRDQGDAAFEAKNKFSSAAQSWEVLQSELNYQLQAALHL